MAVYKLFPVKDATLYSISPTENTGLDELLELSTVYDNQLTYASRPLLQFSQNEIINLYSSSFSSSQWDANLKLFLAYASNIPLEYSLYCYPVSGSWTMGTGHYKDYPIATNGTSWRYRASSGSTAWETVNFGTNTTASFPASQPGGGVWFTSSFSTQSFDYSTSKDINLDVTDIVNLFISGTIENNGFIIKKDDSVEFSEEDRFDLRYFSADTHTIYPPCLEIKWRDFVYSTGNLSSISNSSFKLTLPNNTGFYYSGSIAKVRVNARPLYPSRTFSTSSIYTTNYCLPSASYYAVKDLDTNEYVIDFDDNYTQISADSNGSYFTIYMNGLEPERYYKFLIKTIIDGQTIISDDSYYFKVING